MGAGDGRLAMDERRGMHAVAERDETDDSLEAEQGDFGGQQDAQREDFDGRDAEELGRPTETWRLLAERLEPRIDNMSHAVDGMQVAPYQVLRKGTMQVCDPVNDLRVKVEAVRWMVRIAKRLNGVARELVMATVTKSVEDLEFAIEAQTRLLTQSAAA
jgi:hypothetical protein